jgi:hypothetical protein
LTEVDGLSAWWTISTQGESKIGGILRFRFGAGGFDMMVIELHPARGVLWQVADGPEKWIDTKIGPRSNRGVTPANNQFFRLNDRCRIERPVASLSSRLGCATPVSASQRV